MVTSFHIDGKEILVVIEDHQLERMSKTCFRGTEVRAAGNFFKWNTYEEFINDSWTRRRLVPHLREFMKNRWYKAKRRAPLRFGSDVGWDSVMDIDDLTPDDIAACEHKSLNKGATADFLPLNRILAPATNEVTVVFSKHNEETFKVETIYPGPNVGTAQGDMTRRFGFVWLDWNNEGE